MINNINMVASVVIPSLLNIVHPPFLSSTVLKKIVTAYQSPFKNTLTNSRNIDLDQVYMT